MFDSSFSSKQHLIRFEHRHFVLDDGEGGQELLPTQVLAHLSDCTGWPVEYLQVVTWEETFSSVRVISSLRGGKGGFGSLLKSQSRQAGAKATTNFGACRDLQGRRLRHVNDAAAAQNFSEWQEKIESGQATEDDMVKALVQTSSGVPGWHLQVPAWAEVSKKEHRTWQRQYRSWKREQEDLVGKKRHDRELRESRVQQYVDQASAATASVQASLQSALQEGLQKKAKRSKRERDPPSALVTLAGDVILAANENDVWQIQMKSNFGTFGIVLDETRLESAKNIYWEVRLVTGGLCQLGWAQATTQFQPVSETGDGVGDDAVSYAYDGSRRIHLHGSESVKYGKIWSIGDVIGCLWDRTNRSLSFSVNGQDLGAAFDNLPKGDIFFPSASCNPGEILELHLQTSEMVHAPADATVIGDVLASEDVSFGAADEGKPAPTEKVPEKAKAKEEAASKPAATEAKAAPLLIEALDLQAYETLKDLEGLGLDRLKGALIAIGVKCGGTLTQRAERLFSLKGLDPKDFPPKLLAKKGQ